MTVHAFLASQPAKRKNPRYPFQRRGLITAGSVTLQIRTVDVSAEGFGIIVTEPLHIGKACSITLNAMVGERFVEFHFACTTIFCILAGVDGFRVGLQIDDSIAIHKQQLQSIIAACASQGM